MARKRTNREKARRRRAKSNKWPNKPATAGQLRELNRIGRKYGERFDAEITCGAAQQIIDADRRGTMIRRALSKRGDARWRPAQSRLEPDLATDARASRDAELARRVAML